MAGETYYYEALTFNGPFPGQAAEATNTEESAGFYTHLPQTSFETHAESEKPLLSVEEEHGLALLIQEGLAAQEILPDIDEHMAEAILGKGMYGKMPDWMPGVYTEVPRGALDSTREGEKAKQELVGRNLDLAQKLALASMGILPAGERAAPARRWPVRRQMIVDRLPWLSSESMNLRSPYASVEDRVSVANYGLARAVREFTPGTRQKGKLISFGVFASRIIQEELDSYILGDERPHYDAGSHAVSIDTLHYESAAGEEADTSGEPTMLSAEEVIPVQEPYDPSREAIRSMLADKVREVLSNVLNERYALVVMLRSGFYQEYAKPTFAEIGGVLGVTPARAEQIFKSAMNRLHNSEEMQALAGFHGTEQERVGPQSLRSGDAVKTVQAAGRSTIRLIVATPDNS